MNLSYSLGYLTVVTGRVFANMFGRKIAAAGLNVTMEQWGILRMLLNEDGRTQDSLLPLTRYEKSTLSRVLVGLEKRGLIGRQRGDADARCKQVFLSPEGAEIAEKGTEVVLAALAQLYEGMDQVELDRCRAMLATLQTRLLTMWHGEDA